MSGFADPPVGKPALIAVDWGTTNFRAWLLGAGGTVLGHVQAGQGIRQCAAPFATVLQHEIGSWRQAAPACPVLLSGMIGSRQGWVEAPYVPCPASADAIAAGLMPVAGETHVFIVPGVAFRPRGGAPDVMRGEETQILGLLGTADADRLFVMPGTHSKWVRVTDGVIVSFATYMTGELFAVLRQHSILGALMADGGEDEGFANGVNEGFRHGGTGLIRSLFGVRARGLFDELSAVEAPGYLSGLLIAGELNEALAGEAGDLARAQGVTLVGAGALSRLYALALAQKGISVIMSGEDSGARGLWRVAVAKGLVGADG
ncbi:MAG: 2-dehydro-3-deoxygalactonokinase [Beijerinckiaceae bacterium]